MAYDAKVIEVMIASPGDVADERRVVREVLHDWNALHSRERGVVFMPAGWDTHSAPDLGGRPQALINDRVLSHCDVLVGIFWTRVGSPTGKAISGSVEEIEQHLRQGKPVMLYFSDVPVKADSVDAGQYGQLKTFKAWAMQRGLIATFETPDEFREKFRRDLSINLRDNPHLRSLTTPPPEGSVVVAGPPAIGREQQRSTLSPEAWEALLAAAEGQHGSLMINRHMGGTAIRAGNRSLCDEKDRRAVARWTAAVEELRDHALVRDADGKGVYFEITDAGYRLAEARRSTSP